MFDSLMPEVRFERDPDYRAADRQPEKGQCQSLFKDWWQCTLFYGHPGEDHHTWSDGKQQRFWEDSWK